MTQTAAHHTQHAVIVAAAALDNALAQRREFVLALRAEGWSLQRIADLIGVTKTTAANICQSTPKGL